MKKFIYFHNARCSKSRDGLKLLETKKIDLDIKLYLKVGFNKAELINLFKKLGLAPKDVIRKKEAIYKELDLKNKDLSKSEWIDLIIKHPVLIERPILVGEDIAIIGRPPELFNNFLK